jgi:chromosome segregation ATPase
MNEYIETIREGLNHSYDWNEPRAQKGLAACDSLERLLAMHEDNIEKLQASNKLRGDIITDAVDGLQNRRLQHDLHVNEEGRRAVEAEVERRVEQVAELVDRNNALVAEVESLREELRESKAQTAAVEREYQSWTKQHQNSFDVKLRERFGDEVVAEVESLRAALAEIEACQDHWCGCIDTVRNALAEEKP